MLHVFVFRASNEIDRDPVFTKAQVQAKLRTLSQQDIDNELAAKVDQHLKLLSMAEEQDVRAVRKASKVCVPGKGLVFSCQEQCSLAAMYKLSAHV